ncbi:hypothetical protein IV102_08020 [bacterium]|nr:hypothetical protein [bacterium]
MTTQNTLSQAARERFRQWSGGRDRLPGQDLDRLAQDPQVRGQDAAILSVLKDLPAALGQQDLTCQSLDQVPDRLEFRYCDSLERVNTPRSLFPQGDPDARCVRQGDQPDCVLTSTCISLATQRPESIIAMFEEGDKGLVLRLPGERGRCVSLPTDRELLSHSCAYQNGAWMTVLAKELGPVGRMVPAQAIKKVTGHKVDQDMMFMTSERATRQKLERAMEKRAVVIAGRNGMDDQVAGLTKNHSYAVIGYDPAFARVRLQDPEGNEPLDAQGKPKDGDLDGRFSLPISEFRSLFSSVHYESVDQPSFWGSFLGKVKDAFSVPAGGDGGVPIS